MADYWYIWNKFIKIANRIGPAKVCLLVSLCIFLLGAYYNGSTSTRHSTLTDISRALLILPIIFLVVSFLIERLVRKTSKSGWAAILFSGLFSTAAVLYLGAHPIFFVYPLVCVGAFLWLVFSEDANSNGEDTCSKMYFLVPAMLVLSCLVVTPVYSQEPGDQQFWESVRNKDSKFNEMIGAWLTEPPYRIQWQPTYYFDELDLYTIVATDVYPYDNIERIGVRPPGHPVGVLVTTHKYVPRKPVSVVERAVIYAFRNSDNQSFLRCSVYDSEMDACSIKIDPENGSLIDADLDILWEYQSKRLYEKPNFQCVQEHTGAFSQKCETIDSPCYVISVIQAYSKCLL